MNSFTAQIIHKIFIIWTLFYLNSLSYITKSSEGFCLSNTLNLGLGERGDHAHLVSKAGSVIICKSPSHCFQTERQLIYAQPDRVPKSVYAEPRCYAIIVKQAGSTFPLIAHHNASNNLNIVLDTECCQHSVLSPAMGLLPYMWPICELGGLEKVEYSGGQAWQVYVFQQYSTEKMRGGWCARLWERAEVLLKCEWGYSLLGIWAKYSILLTASIPINFHFTDVHNGLACWTTVYEPNI